MKHKIFHIIFSTLLGAIFFIALTTANADSSATWEAIREYRSAKSKAKPRPSKADETPARASADCKPVVFARSVQAPQGPSSINLELVRSCESVNNSAAAREKAAAK